MSALPPLDTYCFRWAAPAVWPHAVHDVRAIQTTTDEAKVTCLSCLCALDSQRHKPPKGRKP